MRRLDGSRRGFTLVEMLAVAGIVAILAAIAVPRFLAAIEDARTARAIADISTINEAVATYQAAHGGGLPANMSAMIPALIARPLIDPWGTAYVYNNFDVIPPGARRKDGALVPINKLYDIYSMGPDRLSAPPLNSSQGKDDIIFANDGGFIDVASKY